MSGQRKDDHLRLAGEQSVSGFGPGDFDDVAFVHHGLAGVDRDRVSLTTSVSGTAWEVPLYINAMTGGSEKTAEVNRRLAVAARETGVAIASGSMSMCFKDPSSRPSFRVLREENPDGFLMANLSADADPAKAREAVDILEADALQIHINAVQETVMPEGSRDFSAWPENIAAVVDAVDVPVIVKEVGFGLSGETVRLLADVGVRTADVSGRGGTDFARIENDRRSLRDYDYLLGWGLSTPRCLLEAAGAPIEILASGGVRHPLDALRALALGAQAVGAAGTFLRAVLDDGEDGLIALLTAWRDQIGELMAMLGAESVEDLRRTDLLITGAVAEHARLRGIDPAAYARRRH